MSMAHLQQLRNALTQAHWPVREAFAGDVLGVSGYWQIARPNGMSQRTLVFEGLEDLQTLPMEKAYGCFVAENPQISLYFSRINRTFPAALKAFIEQLENEAHPA